MYLYQIHLSLNSGCPGLSSKQTRLTRVGEGELGVAKLLLLPLFT